MSSDKRKDQCYQIFKLYDYLKANHLGKDNAISRVDLALELGIDERELRRMTREINTSGFLEKLVSTSYKCYMCDTKEECETAIKNTYKTAIALLKKAKRMEKKMGLNGQIKMGLGEDYQDVVDTFSKE